MIFPRDTSTMARAEMFPVLERPVRHRQYWTGGPERTWGDRVAESIIAGVFGGIVAGVIGGWIGWRFEVLGGLLADAAIGVIGYAQVDRLLPTCSVLAGPDEQLDCLNEGLTKLLAGGGFVGACAIVGYATYCGLEKGRQQQPLA